jgi:hypothetical protein
MTDDVFQQLTKLVNDPSLPPSVNNALRTARNHYLDETAREAYWEENDKVVRQLIKDALYENDFRIMKRRGDKDQYWLMFDKPMTLDELVGWVTRELNANFDSYVKEALASDIPWGFACKGPAE